MAAWATSTADVKIEAEGTLDVCSAAAWATPTADGAEAEGTLDVSSAAAWATSTADGAGSEGTLAGRFASPAASGAVSARAALLLPRGSGFALGGMAT